MSAAQHSVWEKLSKDTSHGEREEISRTIGKKLLDSNNSLWLEFDAMLEIFCDNAGAAGAKESILMAMRLKFKSFDVAAVVNNFKMTEVCMITTLKFTAMLLFLILVG